MMRRWAQIGGSFAALVVSAGAAQAHIVSSRLGDFYTGALHPLTDLQDFVLWAALGVFAGSPGAARGKWLVLLFPLGLPVGLTLRLDFDITSTGPIAAAAMMVVLGLLVATAVRIPAVVLCLIAVAVAVSRGAANAAGFGPGIDRLLFAAGLASAGYVAITLVSAATVALHGASAAPAGGWRRIAIRACGSWIAAIGLMMGGFALAS